MFYMENKKIMMENKQTPDPKDSEIGVIVVRFQVHELHAAHRALIDKVCANHKKVIIFLGVSVIQNTKNNPLDFATRKLMIQKDYPDVVILPLKDQRSNEKWSYILDNEIKTPFGERTALLYGGRDSFIPYYSGRYPTTELVTDVFLSGTEIRKQVSREILSSNDFRAGVIHANYAQRACTYPTVDVVAYNDNNQILLGKKPNETKYRFIGGFVDRTDENWEAAAKREFSEETGGCEIGDLKYVTSGAIKDWRYAKEESGIMTTLFIGKFIFGSIKPSDDISELRWFNVEDLTDHDSIVENIMPEHVDLMEVFITKYSGILSAKREDEVKFTSETLDKY